MSDSLGKPMSEFPALLNTVYCQPTKPMLIPPPTLPHGAIKFHSMNDHPLSVLYIIKKNVFCIYNNLQLEATFLTQLLLQTSQLFKGTVARDFCFKLRLWGVRLGPTDVTHPLLTAVYCPFNLLQSFKEGTHCSKTDGILLKDTHALSVLV